MSRTGKSCSPARLTIRYRPPAEWRANKLLALRQIDRIPRRMGGSFGSIATSTASCTRSSTFGSDILTVVGKRVCDRRRSERSRFSSNYRAAPRCEAGSRQRTERRDQTARGDSVTGFRSTSIAAVTLAAVGAMGRDQFGGQRFSTPSFRAGQADDSARRGTLATGAESGPSVR